MAKIKTKKLSHGNRPRGVAKHSFEKVYWPYLPILLVIALLLPLSGKSGALQSFWRHPSKAGHVLSYATSMSVSGLLSDTNAARTSNGVAKLKLNSKLDSAAQAKANDMAARDYWSHNTPDGDPPWVFVTDQGYSYQKLGENLATGFSDEQSTINGWMASPPHRENMLNSSYTQVGFGYANIADYTAAGGGPMTIVVAFYGLPYAAPVPASATTTKASVKSASAASKSTVASKPAAAKKELADSQKAQPPAANTDTPA